MTLERETIVRILKEAIEYDQKQYEYFMEVKDYELAQYFKGEERGKKYALELLSDE